MPTTASTRAPATGFPVAVSVTVPAIEPPFASVKSRTSSTSMVTGVESKTGARPLAETPKR